MRVYKSTWVEERGNWKLDFVLFKELSIGGVADLLRTLLSHLKVREAREAMMLLLIGYLRYCHCRHVKSKT